MTCIILQINRTESEIVLNKNKIGFLLEYNSKRKNSAKSAR